MARNSRPSTSAPFLWRMRHSIGRIWFVIALGMLLLGGIVVIYGVATGEFDLLGVGITLSVGGALLAVGFRRKK